MQTISRFSPFLGVALLSLVGCETSPPPAPEVKLPPPQPIAPLHEHIVFFEHHSAAAPNDALSIIRPHVQQLIVNPNRRILIEGHANDGSTPDANYKLGLARAQSIKDLFVAMGVDAYQLEIRSAGHTKPLNFENKPSTAHRNRRVILIY